MQDVVTTNTLEGLVPLVNSFLLPNDYKYTTASGSQSLKLGDHVRLGAAYAGLGIDGAIYRYKLAATYSAAESSNAQTVNVAPNQTVRLPSGWKGLGNAGATYKFLGAAPTSVDINHADYTDPTLWQEVLTNLGAEDYTNTAAWERLNAGASSDLEDYYPGIGNFTNSDARAIGILIVLNDVRSDVTARITNAVVHATAVSVTALDGAMIAAEAVITVNAQGGSFYGTGDVLGAAGQLVTNVVLASASASLSNVNLTASSLVVSASSTAAIDATILAATSTAGDGFGFTLAFNSIGWKAQNFLFNTVDALLGDPLVSSAFNGEQPAATTASVTGSTLNVTGNVTVSADNAALINATVSNAASSVASALYGAKGKSVGAIVASNKVSSLAQATVTSSGVTRRRRRLGGCLRQRGNLREREDGLLVDHDERRRRGGAPARDQQLRPGRLPLDRRHAGAEVRRPRPRQGRPHRGRHRRRRLPVPRPGRVDRPRQRGLRRPRLLAAGRGDDADPAGPERDDAPTRRRSAGSSYSTTCGAPSMPTSPSVTLTAASLSLSAHEAAIIVAIADSSATSSGGSSFNGKGASLAVNATIATNAVQSSAKAYIGASTVTTSGDITATARNASQIDATSLSATVSGAESVGVLLAFNSIGFASQNILFNTLDALFGLSEAEFRYVTSDTPASLEVSDRVKLPSGDIYSYLGPTLTGPVDLRR